MASTPYATDAVHAKKGNISSLYHLPYCFRIKKFAHIPTITVHFHLSHPEWQEFKNAPGEVRLGWLEKVRRLLTCQDLGVPGGWDIMFSWVEPQK